MVQAKGLFRHVLSSNVRSVILNALSVGIVVVLLLFLVSTLWRVWLNDPPIRMRSLDPLTLGVFCPNDEVPIHVFVTVNQPIIMHYYVSVMDAEGDRNIVGTQQAFTDMLHPREAAFENEFPWTVPDLPPGRYRRVVATRNVAGSQKTVFTERFFEVNDTCPVPVLPR